MPLESHWRRFNRAFDHIDALDKSIQRWLSSDAYRIVKEHDPKTRRTAYVAHLGPMPDEWTDLISEAVHQLRTALDHLAYALNAKGYADTHNGAELPPERASKSSFPIFGNVSQAGVPKDGERAFRINTSYADMPAGAIAVIEKLQPYRRGKHFRRDPLWAIYELSRIDKHRLDLVVTASGGENVRFSGTISGPAAFGVGGPIYDGKELSHWIAAPGYEEPDVDYDFTGGVAFGEATSLGNQPVVPTLRGIRDYLRYRVAFPLDKFL